MRFCLFVLLLFSLSAFPADETESEGDGAEIPALRVELTNAGTNDKVEITAAVTEASNEPALSDAMAADVKGDLKRDPTTPVTIVVVGEGDSPAIQPANDAAKGENLGVAPVFGVTVGEVTHSPLARFGQKLAERFKGAKLFYTQRVRPKLPISPNTPQDYAPETLRTVKIKALLGGGATALVLFVFKENVSYSTEYILNGLTLTALQTSIAMATAYRNTEFIDWMKDKDMLRASGIQDTGAFVGIKRDIKMFSILAVLISLANAEAGLLNLKPTMWDPSGAAIAAGLTTVIGKGWYGVVADHLKVGSPWRAYIPVFAYAVANIGNVAAIVHGPLNVLSFISWGGLGGSGFATYYALKNREAVSNFVKQVPEMAIVRNVVVGCKKVFSAFGGWGK